VEFNSTAPQGGPGAVSDGGVGLIASVSNKRTKSTDEAKSRVDDEAARDEILQRRPELKGKSLEAMRRILRREATPVAQTQKVRQLGVARLIFRPEFGSLTPL